MMATSWAKRRAAAVLLALFPLLMAVGCGKTKGTVKGTVYFKDPKKGEIPMPGGSIAFIPVESGGRGGTFPINPEDGTFSAEGMSVGKMKITIQPVPSSGSGGGSGPPRDKKDRARPPKDAGFPEEMKDKFDPSKGPGTHVPVNKKYQNLETTPLEVTVEKGEQDLPIRVD